ncbi:hypothetical protein Tco_1549902 [Tanacetum coccineum]
MSWREFILALVLHTVEELESPGFARDISTDGDFLGPPLSYTLIRDLLLRLCHRMMAQSIAEGDAGGVAEEASVAPRGGDKDEEMPQAMPPPPRTQGKRIARLKEEVHGMREVLQGQREVVDSMAHDFFRFTRWTITSLSRMMDRTGVTYTRYSELPIEYQRRSVRQRTDEPSTLLKLRAELRRKS